MAETFRWFSMGSAVQGLFSGSSSAKMYQFLVSQLSINFRDHAYLRYGNPTKELL
jgi:hypothetical protein